MPSPHPIAQFALADALRQGPPPLGNLAVPIFAHGTLVVELYKPVDRDPQAPHTRDEVYIVARGQGQFFDGEQSRPGEPGALLFVPAGRVHRFENFTPDFAVSGLFYGPRRRRAVSQLGSGPVRAAWHEE